MCVELFQFKSTNRKKRQMRIKTYKNEDTYIAMDALDSYDLHNTDDYDDDPSSDDFNEDAYAYDLIQNKLKH